LQCPLAGQRDRPGEIPVPALRQDHRLDGGIRVHPGQRRGQTARVPERERADCRDASKRRQDLLRGRCQLPIWIAHAYELLDLVELRDNAGRVVWVNAFGGAREKVPGQLFGLPVYVSEKVPTYGTKGDLCLVDPKYCVIGDRM